MVGDTDVAMDAWNINVSTGANSKLNSFNKCELDMLSGPVA